MRSRGAERPDDDADLRNDQGGKSRRRFGRGRPEAAPDEIPNSETGWLDDLWSAKEERAEIGPGALPGEARSSKSGRVAPGPDGDAHDKPLPGQGLFGDPGPARPVSPPSARPISPSAPQGQRPARPVSPAAARPVSPSTGRPAGPTREGATPSWPGESAASATGAWGPWGAGQTPQTPAAPTSPARSAPSPALPPRQAAPPAPTGAVPSGRVPPVPVSPAQGGPGRGGSVPPADLGQVRAGHQDQTAGAFVTTPPGTPVPHGGTAEPGHGRRQFDPPPGHTTGAPIVPASGNAPSLPASRPVSPAGPTRGRDRFRTPEQLDMRPQSPAPAGGYASPADVAGPQQQPQHGQPPGHREYGPPAQRGNGRQPGQPEYGPPAGQPGYGTAAGQTGYRPTDGQPGYGGSAGQREVGQAGSNAAYPGFPGMDSTQGGPAWRGAGEEITGRHSVVDGGSPARRTTTGRETSGRHGAVDAGASGVDASRSGPHNSAGAAVSAAPGNSAAPVIPPVVPGRQGIRAPALPGRAGAMADSPSGVVARPGAVGGRTGAVNVPGSPTAGRAPDGSAMPEQPGPQRGAVAGPPGAQPGGPATRGVASVGRAPAGAAADPRSRGTGPVDQGLLGSPGGPGSRGARTPGLGSGSPGPATPTGAAAGGMPSAGGAATGGWRAAAGTAVVGRVPTPGLAAPAGTGSPAAIRARARTDVAPSATAAAAAVGSASASVGVRGPGPTAHTTTTDDRSFDGGNSGPVGRAVATPRTASQGVPLGGVEQAPRTATGAARVGAAGLAKPSGARPALPGPGETLGGLRGARTELRARMRSRRRLRVVTLMSLAGVVLVLLPAIFGLRATVKDPVFGSLDALNVPSWAAARIEDRTSGSRWCFLDCRFRERSATSQRPFQETTAIYAKALTAAGWQPWKVAECPDQPIDPAAGTYSCWRREEFTLDLRVSLPDCAVDALAAQDPAVLPSTGVAPTADPKTCVGSTVNIKVQNAITDTRGRQEPGRSPDLVGETPDPSVPDVPLLTPTPAAS